MVKWRSILASGIPTVVLAAAALVSPASAAADESGLQQASSRKVSTATAAPSWHYPCFGYEGTFKSGSGVLIAPWNECFGIAPDRTIWHAWPGSGGWREMPNHGHADYMVYPARIDSAGRRVVAVWVNGYGDYCSWLMPPWKGWYGC